MTDKPVVFAKSFEKFYAKRIKHDGTLKQAFDRRFKLFCRGERAR